MRSTLLFWAMIDRRDLRISGQHHLRSRRALGMVFLLDMVSTNALFFGSSVPKEARLDRCQTPRKGPCISKI